MEQKLAVKLLRKLIRNGMVRTFTKSTVLKVARKAETVVLHHLSNATVN